MTGYEVKIGFCSKELTAKERIQLKDTTDAIKLDDATKDGSIIITPDFYAELIVHNEKAKDNPDYTQAIVIDTDGQKYVTGSNAFWDSFMNIADEMKGESEEWSIKVYRVPSKNYKGKDFITCSIV